MEENNLCIVPPKLWPRFFDPPGVYDISNDKIFVNGWQPAPIRERVINHEKGHRAWWLRRSSLTIKLCILFFGAPGIFFGGGVLSVLASISSQFLGNSAKLWYWSISGIVLLFLYAIIWLWLLEIPARKVDKLNRAEKSIGIKFTFGPGLPYLPLVLAFVGMLFGGTIFLLLLNTGLLVTWLLQFYYNYWALRILRRITSTLATNKN
jgi:hypothetical protein